MWYKNIYLSIIDHLSVCVYISDSKKLNPKLKDKTLENIKLYLTTERLICTYHNPKLVKIREISLKQNGQETWTVNSQNNFNLPIKIWRDIQGQN